LRALLYVDQHPATLARDKHCNATLLATWREAFAGNHARSSIMG